MRRRPPQTQILVPGTDHSYRLATVQAAEVVWNSRTGEFREWGGAEYDTLEDHETKTTALIAI